MQSVWNPADQCRRRSVLESGANIIVAVDPFARQGDEQAARSHLAAVDDQVFNRESGTAKGAARRLDQLVRCPKRSGHRTSPRRADTTARAASLSSKGRVSVPTI